MENRRLLASQRKAEEEKARALETEKKMKEEGERRKREREETTEKRTLKAPLKKVLRIVGEKNPRLTLAFRMMTIPRSVRW